jgi:hypothetical protein
MARPNFKTTASKTNGTPVSADRSAAAKRAWDTIRANRLAGFATSAARDAAAKAAPAKAAKAPKAKARKEREPETASKS